MAERSSFLAYNRIAALRQKLVQKEAKYSNFGAEKGNISANTSPFTLRRIPGEKYLDYGKEQRIEIYNLFPNKLSYFPVPIPPTTIPYVDPDYVLYGYVLP